jgi:hypothetical protein
MRPEMRQKRDGRAYRARSVHAVRALAAPIRKVRWRASVRHAEAIDRREIVDAGVLRC